jgi:pentatricopeptide repeat protein
VVNPTRLAPCPPPFLAQGCERSVITYSTLISACEKAGEWELALQLFEEMRGEGCVPNVISYNSLITACAQGAQWEKAAEVFEAMQRQGCRPDVVTYTALISAYEKGGQWRRALAAFEEMRRRPCPPDAIVYAAIIDALWDTGLSWAQRRAVALYKQAAQVSVCVCVSVCWAGGGRAHVPGGMGEWGRGTRGLGAHAGLHGTDAARGWAAPGGMEGGAGAGRISSRGVGTAPRVDRARLAGPLPRRAGCAEPAGPFSPCHPPPQEGLNRSHSHECGGSWELNLHSTTAGVALLSLHCWLHELQ